MKTETISEHGLRYKLPSDWRILSVKDLILEHKQGYYTGQSYSSSGIKLVRITDLLNPRLSYETMPFLNVDEKTIQQFKVDVGDFLVARSGAIGRYGIAESNFPCIFGSYIIRFKLKSELIDKFFLGYLYQSQFIFGQLIRIKQGASNININAENIKKMKIPIPPFSEQQKIVAILSKIDDLIRKTEEIIEQTRRLKKGLMQILLQTGIGHTEFRITPIGRIPESWHMAHLREISHRIMKGIFDIDPIEYVKTGIPFLRISDIETNIVNASSVKYIPDDLNKKFNASELRPGDIILAKVGASAGSTEKVAKIPNSMSKCNISQNLIGIRVNHDKIYSDFLLDFLQLPKNMNTILSRSNTTTFKSIQLNVLRDILVPLPPLEEQKRISEIISTIDGTIKSNISSRYSMDLLKQGLMQNLLTGKIRVKL
jgi:type I restriction enzyme, S subunit